MQNEISPPCPFCGGTAFTWGEVSADGQAVFKSNDSGFIEKWTNFGGQKIRGRMCNSCQNLALFVEGQRSY